MGASRARSVSCQPATMKPLTKEEIDRRIGELVAEVAAGAELEEADRFTDPDFLSPRWIEPAELVRRLQPFLVYN